MFVQLDKESFKKLVKISNIKRQYLGDVAADLLTEAILKTDIKELRLKYESDGEEEVC